MKFLSWLMLLTPVFLHAQSDRDWGTISSFINVSGHAGKKFKLEAAIKVQTIDSAGGAAMYTAVYDANRKWIATYNLNNQHVHNSNWVVYTVNGKLDKNAAYMTCGAGYNRRGIYYYDNFRLLVEDSKDKYEEIPIPNNSFEADSLKPWFYDNPPKGFTIGITKDTAFEGKQALKADGADFENNQFGDNDKAGKHVFVNGIKIYYETYGTGETLLLLHGNSTSINLFKAQIPELSKHYRVIAVDTRGQGRSGDDDKTYTYDLFAEDMNALLDYLHLDSVNILGWSDGGNTGLIMAMKYPAKVKKLVAMGAVIFINNTVVDDGVFKTLNKELRELKNNTDAQSKNRTRLINLLLTEPRHTADELKTIKCPVLIVAGEKDIVKEGHTRLIAEHIPNSRLLIAPGQTHSYPAEDPASFNKAVLEFLGK